LCKSGEGNSTGRFILVKEFGGRGVQGCVSGIDRGSVLLDVEVFHGVITVNIGEHTKGEGHGVMTRFKMTYGKRDSSKTT